MNIPDHLVPAGWLIGAAFIALPLLLAALLRAPWAELRRPEHLHLWLGASVFLLALWQVKTGIRPGLNFHLLGMTGLCLMFGPCLALLSGTLLLLAITLWGDAGWQALPLNLCLMVILPVLISHAIYRSSDRFLPNHVFLYIFIDAFFTAGLAMALTGLAICTVLAESGAYPWSYLTDNYLAYYLFMAWGEALLTGMGVTLMVVYKPEWLVSFDDDRYIKGK
jgi:uncharacterized membrane protein